ncbi:MAG: hypothetical protein PHH28_00160 [Desulfuromonadaceae bacterium]|nr:hypothetical protein [Desulfuromonadaceae bacterium]
MKTSLNCNSFIKLTLCVLFVVCFIDCGSAFAATNDAINTVSVNYIIKSLGSEIGTVSAKTTGTARDNDFQADTNVKVHFWFINFSLSSCENARIREGKLVKYHKIVDTNGHRKEITGKLIGNVFEMVTREGGKEQHTDIPTTGYVSTTIEYPEVTLALGEIRKMLVVDLGTSAIVGRKYRHVTEEHTKINGRDNQVIVSDFSDKNAEGRRWTTIIAGLPIVLRQEGKEKVGLFNSSYKVLETKVAIGP